MPTQKLFLVIAAGLICLLPAWAEDTHASAVSPAAAANLPAQRIGRNDLVSISIFDAPELSRTYRVGTNGKIRIPMLATRIDADGLFPADLEEQIAAALEKENIMVKPVVTVTVAEYASRPISVSGAVKNPTTFQAIGNITLLEAIARAGGLTPEVGDSVLLTSRSASADPASAPLTTRISIKSLIDDADPTLNVTLTGGEEIRVPEAGKVFVVGNVKKPGAFPAGGKTDATILKALAYAEGLMPYASNSAYIYRKDDKGAKQEIVVELKQIMTRKTEDVALLPNDILYVPDNVTKRNTVGALERALGFSTSTASGLLIWKH